MLWRCRSCHPQASQLAHRCARLPQARQPARPAADANRPAPAAAPAGPAERSWACHPPLALVRPPAVQHGRVQPSAAQHALGGRAGRRVAGGVAAQRRCGRGGGGWVHWHDACARMEGWCLPGERGGRGCRCRSCVLGLPPAYAFTLPACLAASQASYPRWSRPARCRRQPATHRSAAAAPALTWLLGRLSPATAPASSQNRLQGRRTSSSRWWAGAPRRGSSRSRAAAARRARRGASPRCGRGCAASAPLLARRFAAPRARAKMQLFERRGVSGCRTWHFFVCFLSCQIDFVAGAVSTGVHNSLSGHAGIGFRAVA